MAGCFYNADNPTCTLSTRALSGADRHLPDNLKPILIDRCDSPLDKVSNYVLEFRLMRDKC